ncbi:MAG: hypothetical protein HC827_19355 [Cyanobacteria bacterium RM1_2_2]|nr:hypothetical protein [Cyanobacteria bacterium RM1_2_2]
MADTEAIVQNLLELDEDELVAQIGIKAQTIEQDASAADLESLAEPMAVPRAGWDDIFQFGQGVFSDTSAKAYKLLCTPLGGENADTNELVQELEKLLGAKTAEAATKATTLLAPVLVGSLGLPQSLAVLISTLLVKRLAKGASNLICEKWQASLTPTAEASASLTESTVAESTVAESTGTEPTPDPAA